MVNNKVPFLPIQGLEAIIHQQDVTPGNLYFATDSGKILLDTDSGRVILGANGAAVLYSSVDGLKSNANGSYSIPHNKLSDSKAIPKKDDLIINIDGRFFRVNYFNGTPGTSDLINCKLIAVSGTGGGGGSGGGEEEDPKYIDVMVNPMQSYSFLYGKQFTFDFTATATLDKELNVTYTVRNDLAIFYTGKTKAISGHSVSLDIGKYILPENGEHKLEITISGANSTKRELEYNGFNSVNLNIDHNPKEFTVQQVYENIVPYSVIVTGAIDKTLNLEIDDQPYKSQFLSSKQQGSIRIDIDCSVLGLNAGIHTVKAWLEADGVPSNEITTDFIYHPKNAFDATYVIVTDYPAECMSYDIPKVSYWVFNTAQPQGYINNIALHINGVKIDEIQHAQNNAQSIIWNVAGLASEETNICEIKCGNASRTFEIFCHYSNRFEPAKDGAVIMLNAEGRSNNTSLERRLEWSYGDYKAVLKDFNWNNNGWVTDTNSDRSCLRISNGASVEIPLELFEYKDQKVGGYTFEFEFNPYNLYSYQLLTQSTTTTDTGNDEVDSVVITRDFNADLAAISYIATGNDKKAFGFCCGTQDAFFRMSDGSHATVRYNNNNIVNVAVTINAADEQICMYVNGVMSGMSKYDRTSAELPIYANKLIINSEHCDLDLFNIRIYNKVLKSSEIVQNYIASKKDMELYEQNAFSGGDNTVNLSELQDYNRANPDNATIPYMIFKTKAPDQLPFNKANADVICSIEFVNPALDYALLREEIDEDYYKKHAPSFTADEVTINVQGTSSQKYPRRNFKGKFKNAKNWKCREASVEDRIKNLELSKFYMDDNMAEKTFTWKADFMDSSSCHNTGFASYVYNLYWNHPLDYIEGTNVAVGGPEKGVYHKQYRTSLYGFPVLVFHQKSDNSIEFIGRYNFNLDKGADDTLGMALDKKHKVLTDKTYEQICECWEMANNMGGRCSFRGNPFDFNYDYNYLNADGTKGNYVVNGKPDGKSDIGDDIEVRYHINGDAIEGAWINSTKPEGDDGDPISAREAFEILLGGDENGNNRTGAYAHLEKFYKWIQDCYYAFNLDTQEDYDLARNYAGQKAVAEKEAGYFTNALTKISEYRAEMKALESLVEGSESYVNQVNICNQLSSDIIYAALLTKDEHYIIEKGSKTEGSQSRVWTLTIITIEDENIIEMINNRSNSITDADSYEIQKDATGAYYNDAGEPVDIFLKMVKDEKRTKFENEFDNHLNKEYCTIYYIMTELLLQYDSRGKNMMFSSWGPKEPGGDYIWFPIFYDIDTQLGVNNSGIPSWEYNVEPTTGFNAPGGNRAFSTANSLLWNNFHESFAVRSSFVQDRYRMLRGGRGLDEVTLNGYYNFDYNVSGQYFMKGIYPINVMNANQYYKYILPSVKDTNGGYLVSKNGQVITDYTDAYFYCLQGTRDLHRAQLLRNRFNYYDSKWMAQDYQPGTGGSAMRIRVNAYKSNEHPELNSKLSLSVVPALDQYLVMWPDESDTFVQPIFAKGGTITEIDLKSLFTSSEYQQQLIYIGGYDYLQELGDLSLLYLDEWEYPAAATNTVKILLGNESPFYKPNEQFKVDAIPAATATKPLLKEFDITNINKITNSINLTDSVKLESFKAIGSKITGATFADGVNLKVLQLPETTNTLQLNKASNLTKIIYNENQLKETLDDGTVVDAEGIYIHNVITDKQGSKSTGISTVNIVGGNLKLYSYDFLDRLTEAVLDMITVNKTGSLSINMEEVHWSPYTQLGEGAVYDNTNTNNYYYATNNYSYIPYEWINEDKWVSDLLNGRIYLYERSSVQPPVDLSLLDTYISEIKNPIGAYGPEHFTNIASGTTHVYPVITGEMYVNNTESISEADIANIYNSYFPSLTIRAANISDAYRARFVSYVDGVEKELFVQRVSQDEENPTFTFPANEDVPAPSNRVFAGWSLIQPTGDYDTDLKNIIPEEDLVKYKFSNQIDNDPYTAMEFTFYAVYNRETYTITFTDTKTIPEETTPYFVQLNALYEEQMPEPSDIPYRPVEEEAMTLTDRIVFKGWTNQEARCGIALNETEANNAIIKDFQAQTVKSNQTFYPVYYKENVYSKATDAKYFDFVPFNDKGYAISQNPRYRLSGKITIPATGVINGVEKPIVSIGHASAESGGFKEISQVSHIFFMSNPELTTVYAGAFMTNVNNSYNGRIKGIYLPESIISIGAKAFEGLKSLQHISEKYVNDNEVGYLNNNLKTLGTRAFFGSGVILKNLPNNEYFTRIESQTFMTCNNVEISELPPNIEFIGSQAFNNCPKVNITKFGWTEDLITSKLKTIEFRAFERAGSSVNNPTSIIYVGSGVNHIGQATFYRYGNGSVDLYTTLDPNALPDGWFRTIVDGVEGPVNEGIGVNSINQYTGEV